MKNNLYTSITGDPFADTGGDVVRFLYELYPDKSIVELVEYVTDVYINKFDCKLNAYFLNHPLTQAAWGKNRRRSETLKYYHSLLEGRVGYQGTCSISGENGVVFNATRGNSILTGSKTFVNFHANLNSGIPMSKEIIIRMYFAPLGMIRFGKNIINIRSNNEKVNRCFVDSNCKNNLLESSTEFAYIEGMDYGGCIFNFLNNVLKNGYDDNKALALNIYKFSNYAASPGIEIDIVDQRLFSFYKYVYNNDQWWSFIETYDKEESNSNGEYVYNPIFYNLLKKINILPAMRDYAENHLFDFDIACRYLNATR